MVHYRRGFGPAFALTSLAKRVRVEEDQTLSLPLRTVAPLGSLALVVSPRWGVRPTRHRHPQRKTPANLSVAGAAIPISCIG